MKKLTNKLVILLAFFLFSCDKKNELETVFIAKKNEYWDYKNNCGNHGVYFKFHKDGSYDKYNKYINEGFELFNNDGDLISGKRVWNIKNDSIFCWDNEEYIIKSYDTKKIILTYSHNKEKGRICSITLKKVIDE